MNSIMYLSEKQEYAAIDFARFVAALIVVAIHISPLTEANELCFFWFNQILFKTAVPFFFVTSGFFVALKIDNIQKLILYTRRILLLYILYTVLYFPQIIYSYMKENQKLSGFFVYFMRIFFLEGSYTQFWYFLALIVAVWLLAILKRCGLSGSQIFAISIFLYCISVFECAYKSLFFEVPFISGVLNSFDLLFPIVKSGLLIAFPFVAIGYFVRTNRFCLKRKNYVVLALIAFLLLNLEAFKSISSIGYEGQDRLFSTWLFALFAFLAISSFALDENFIQKGKILRKLSVLIFGFHLFVRFYAHILFVKICELDLNSLGYFVLMTISTIIFSYIILRLSEHARFHWLKWLY